MKRHPGPKKNASAEADLKDIQRATHRRFSAEEKVRIVLEGLRGEDSHAALCRREGVAGSMDCGWSKVFLEAGKGRLAGDTARQATSKEVKDLRCVASARKGLVADLTLENRLLNVWPALSARRFVKLVADWASVAPTGPRRPTLVLTRIACPS